MVSRSLAEQVKVGLAASAIIAIFFGYILARWRRYARDNEEARAFLEETTVVGFGRYRFNARQSFVGALLVFVLLGTLNYSQYDKDLLLNKYDPYDLLHYYLNAKYFDELQYFHLLPAMITADRDAGQHCPGDTPIYLAQDDNDYVVRPIEHAYAREAEVKALFTEERWREFYHDMIFIQRAKPWLGCKMWRMLLQDHGFNGTPSWVLIARPIASVIPVESIKFAAAIDLLLIIAMLYGLAWAMGRETMLLAWLFVIVGYSFRWPIVSWAFLRYDWVVALVLSMCFARKKHYVAAGAFIGYAALMRYFPALWAFGIVAKGVHALLTNKRVPLKQFWKRVPTRFYKMGLGFVAVVVVIISISMIRDGPQAHAQSLHNITAHVKPEHLSSRRQGLVIPLTYRGETDQKLISKEKKRMVGEIEDEVRVAAVALLLVLGLFLTRVKDEEAIGFAAMPYFWLTTSSYYYYSLRLTLIALHARDLSKPRNVAGLVILFGIELFSNASEHINPGNRYFLINWMGIGLILYCAVMLAMLGRQWWRERKIDLYAD
jgi:uncharacterized membrane protein